MTLLLLWFSIQTTDCNARLQSQFTSRYRDYAAAVRSMDVDRYMSYFADDFSMRSPDGKLHDKAEMAHYQRINAQTTKRVNSYSADVECVRTLANGDVAAVIVQKYDRDQAPLKNRSHLIRQRRRAIASDDNVATRRIISQQLSRKRDSLRLNPNAEALGWTR